MEDDEVDDNLKFVNMFEFAYKINQYAFEINEVEFVGEFAEDEERLFQNIIITTEMMKKFDTFTNDSRCTMVKFKGEFFYVANILKHVKSNVQSPESIWRLIGLDFYLEYHITEKFLVVVSVSKYNIAVSLSDNENVIGKNILFISI